MCNACEDGFHARPWRTTVETLDCAACPGAWATIAALAAGALLFAVVVYACRTYVRTGFARTRAYVQDRLAAKVPHLATAPTAWLKIVWVTYQIISQSDWATHTAYPPPFAYSNAVLSLVELDVAALSGFACTLDLDALDRMALAAAAPTLLVMCLGAAALCLARRGGVARRRLSFLALLVLFATLPTASTPALRTFACRKFDDGISVLEADYSVSCKSRRYSYFRCLAALVVVAWPLGVPLSIFLALYRVRHRLDPTSHAMDALEADALARARSSDDDLRMTAFLWASYRPSMYFWECVDMFRRILLTGGLSFAGSPSMRCLAGCAISVAFLLGVEVAAPHGDAGSSTLNDRFDEVKTPPAKKPRPTE